MLCLLISSKYKAQEEKRSKITKTLLKQNNNKNKGCIKVYASQYVLLLCLKIKHISNTNVKPVRYKSGIFIARQKFDAYIW